MFQVALIFFSQDFVINSIGNFFLNTNQTKKSHTFGEMKKISKKDLLTSLDGKKRAIISG